MFDFIKNWYQRRTMFVIADSKDNSVTLSKKVFDCLGGFNTECDDVLVFKVKGKYAFTNYHSVDGKATDLMKLQYNSKLKCAGFECRVPTVNKIFYDYGIPSGISCKLSIEVHSCGAVKKYYVIMPPDKKLLKRLWKLAK